MTHTNHRRGTIESLSKDYVVFVYAARGINNKDAGPKCQRFLRMAFEHSPVNAGSPQVGNLSTVSADELIEGAGNQTKAYAVFDDKEKAQALVKDVTKADMGLSVIVSGLLKEVDDMCQAAGIKKHTVQCSLGVWGQTERLPEEEILNTTTMCGHAVVSTGLVKRMARDVANNLISLEKAAKILAKPCACGVFNPKRAEEVLKQCIDSGLVA